MDKRIEKQQVVCEIVCVGSTAISNRLQPTTHPPPEANNPNLGACSKNMNLVGTKNRGLSINYSHKIAGFLQRNLFHHPNWESANQLINFLRGGSCKKFEVFKGALKRALQFEGVCSYLNSQQLERDIWKSPQGTHKNKKLAVEAIPRLREIMEDPDSHLAWDGRWKKPVNSETTPKGHRFRTTKKSNQPKAVKTSRIKKSDSQKKKPQHQDEPFPFNFCIESPVLSLKRVLSAQLKTTPFDLFSEPGLLELSRNISISNSLKHESLQNEFTSKLSNQQYNFTKDDLIFGDGSEESNLFPFADLNDFGSFFGFPGNEPRDSKEES